MTKINQGFSYDNRGGSIIILKAETPPTLEQVSPYYSAPPTYPVTLYVPDSALAAYQADSDWVAAVTNILPLSQCPAKYLEYHEYKPTFVRGDYGRRYAIISGYDERIKAWSRKQYLTFEAREDNTVVNWSVQSSSIIAKTIAVSTDGGTTWENKTATLEGTLLATLSSGQKMIVKRNQPTVHLGQNYFSSNKEVYVYGNMMSLVYGDNFIGQTSFAVGHGFRALFNNMTTLLTDTHKGYIVIPVASIALYGLYGTFAGCSRMKVPPIIDATNVSDWGCAYAFSNSGILYVPNLHFTQVGGSSFQEAFRNTPVKKAVLPPVTALGSNASFRAMYMDCGGLIEMADLSKITSVRANSFYSFYQNCGNLSGKAVLPDIATLYDDCYNSMFLGTKVEEVFLPSATPATRSYAFLLRGNTSIKKITCLATDISATDCLQYWLLGAPSTGTFVKPASVTYPSGASGIPTGWTVQDYNA